MTQNQINFARAKEEARHNLVMESQGYASIDESMRHNKASEAISWYTGGTQRILVDAQVPYYTAQTYKSEAEAEYTSGAKTEQTQAQTEHTKQETRYYPIVALGGVKNVPGALVGAGLAGVQWISDSVKSPGYYNPNVTPDKGSPSGALYRSLKQQNLATPNSSYSFDRFKIVKE